MAKRADAELKAASFDLFYEYDMMRELVPKIAGAGDQLTHNALLESFLVHVRNLAVFLGWHESNHGEDVLAKHYVKGFKSNAPKSTLLSDLYEQACTQVVHLSYGRKRVEPEKRTWPLREIAEAVSAEVERFVKLAPAHLLDGRWQQSRGPVFPSHSPVFPYGITAMAHETFAGAVKTLKAITLRKGDGGGWRY